MLNTGVPSRSKSFREKAREKFGFSRNKSRSVEVKRPSTLSSIRSKIQTVSASIKDTVAPLPEDVDITDSGAKSGRTPRPCVPTVEHKVRPGETLSSIAAQFDTTPSELCSLNRLSMRTVFADQVIKVPDPEVRAQLIAELEAAKLAEEQASTTNLASSPRAGPGLAARVPASPSALSTKSAGPTLGEEPESVHERQFVKSDRAKLITWGEGVISGVLIVTPQSLMFDPGYSDPLVIERGHVYFQVHVDLVHVLSVSVYKDPRAMRLLAPGSDEDGELPSHADMLLELGAPDDKSEATSDVFRPPSAEPLPGEEQSVDCTRGEAETADKDPGQTEEQETEVSDEKADAATSEPAKKASPADVTPNRVEDASPTDAAPEPEKSASPIDLTPKGAEEESPTDAAPEKKASPGGEITKDERTSPAEACPEQEVAPDSAADNSAFNMDDSAWQLQLDSFLPRPSRHYDDAPVYMCIRHRPGNARARKSGRPSATSASPSRPSSGSSSGAMAGVVKQEEKLPDHGQHWFSIPQENARELYAFLRRSGVSDRARDELPSSASAPLSAPAGPDPGLGASHSLFFGDADKPDAEPFFVLHESHYANSPARSPSNHELSLSADSRSDRLLAIRQESLEWELISRTEMQAVCGVSPGGTLRQETLEEELPLPTLIGKTLMLTEPRLRDLMKNLPTRAEGCINMRLSYSTAQHGFSLATLYRRCKRDIEDRPCILLINTQGAPEDTCFGAVLSHSMHISDHYYGNGETKLIRWTPELEIADWTGENNYILKGGCRTFMVGSSNGRVAVWLDEDLYRGRSQVCETFEMRQPLTHDAKEDFIIENLEVWTFN